MEPQSEPQVGFEPTTARLRIECSTPELLWPINTAGAHGGAPPTRCPGADSNRDAFRHYPLKIACLPVSPPGRAAEQDSGRPEAGQPQRAVSNSLRPLRLPDLRRSSR